MLAPGPIFLFFCGGVTLRHAVVASFSPTGGVEVGVNLSRIPCGVCCQPPTGRSGAPDAWAEWQGGTGNESPCGFGWKPQSVCLSSGSQSTQRLPPVVPPCILGTSPQAQNAPCAHLDNIWSHLKFKKSPGKVPWGFIPWNRPGNVVTSSHKERMTEMTGSRSALSKSNSLHSPGAQTEPLKGATRDWTATCVFYRD